jgi:hypothetical protein
MKCSSKCIHESLAGSKSLNRHARALLSGIQTHNWHYSTLISGFPPKACGNDIAAELTGLHLVLGLVVFAWNVVHLVLDDSAFLWVCLNPIFRIRLGSLLLFSPASIRTRLQMHVYLLGLQRRSHQGCRSDKAYVTSVLLSLIPSCPDIGNRPRDHFPVEAAQLSFLQA